LRIDDSGLYEFLGRVDRQVKLRGHRVELKEVEAVLSEHDAVHDVVTIVTDTGSSHTARLVAFVVSTSEVQETELRQHAMKLLPSYMVPSKIYFFRDDLSRNPNGKIDILALKTMAAASELRETDVNV
jgi:acyl-coenzyme A synthetase/AMP-(fatty) acid ligase